MRHGRLRWIPLVGWNELDPLSSHDLSTQLALAAALVLPSGRHRVVT